MQRILVAVDGSKAAERAVRHVIRLGEDGMSLQVLMLNVQPEWAPARSKEEAEEGRRMHTQASARDTRRARALLEAAAVPHEDRMLVGDAAQSIVKLAHARRCSQIVMGMRGRWAIARVPRVDEGHSARRRAGNPGQVDRTASAAEQHASAADGSLGLRSKVLR